MSKPTHAALASLSLSALLASLGTSIANVGLPTFAQAFHATLQQVQWIVLAYLLAVTALVVAAGRLGDLAGRRRLLLAGIGLFTLASIACGLAPTLGILIAARAVQGAGAAIMMALALALVGAAAPKDRTGSAMGLLGTMSAIGTALGPSLGGALIAAYGWRALFFLSVPMGMLAMLLAHLSLPPDGRDTSAGRPGFDAAGTSLLALALTAYALAMTLGRGDFGAVNAVLLVVAMAGVGLFIAAEGRAASPLVPLALFRDRATSAAFAMSALVTSVVMATLLVGPFHLSAALGLDAARVGLVMSAGPIVAALAGVPAGRFVDRLGSRRTSLAGLSAMAAGSAMLSLAPVSAGVPGYIAPLVVVTAGYALFQAANNTAVMRDAGAEWRGVVSGLLNLARNLGLVTGASLMGAVFALGASTTDIATAPPAAVAAGMRATFAVATMLVLVALALAASTGPRLSRA